MSQPSPAFQQGLATASSRACPVAHCQAEPGSPCSTSLMVRGKDKSQPPTLMVLTGPHFERVLPDWVDSSD